MKKNKTGKKIILGILLILITIGLSTWARYTSGIEANGSVTVAKYVTDVQTIEFVDLPTQPGEITDVRLNISSFKDREYAETKVNYWFEFKTAGNLPFTFDIYDGSGHRLLQQGLTANTKSNVFELDLMETGYRRPHMVKINWPVNKNDAKYAELVDYVKIKVHMEQAKR